MVIEKGVLVMCNQCIKRKCYFCYILILGILLFLIWIFDYCFHPLIENIINFLNLLVAFALLIVAYQAKDDWQKQIKCKHFEKAKKKLILSLFDCVQTFSTHCYLDPTLSSITEINAEAAKNVHNDENATRNEIYNIDIEFTRKIRDLNKAFALFEFYCEKDISINDLDSVRKFKYKIIEWSNNVRHFDFAKFRFYLNPSRDGGYEILQKKLQDIKPEMESILNEFENIKIMLKKF